CLQYNRKPFTF
nr:immunoglobulin light chain junction region [Macaca mulatta]MOV36979.1 immunoglobulin light chain junction region [Macaca mulatta]MOV37000.1 immunoglobulin light chain junction region [Macaca mulatta]MOV37028.1 immunoglobulin light chain junction region [Macaca mulatta]MOV37057.1 immunoglobulin light chain junction region [Macaca mulatta]